MKNRMWIFKAIILLLCISVLRVSARADTQYAHVINMVKSGAVAAFGSGRTDIVIDSNQPYADATLNTRYLGIRSSMSAKSNTLNVNIQRGTGRMIGVGWGGDDDLVTNIKITDIPTFPAINAKKRGKGWADAADDNPSGIVWTNDRTAMVIILADKAYERPAGWTANAGYYYKVFPWNPSKTVAHLTFDLYLSGDSKKYFTGDNAGQKWHRNKLKNFYDSLNKSKIHERDWVRGIFFWTLAGSIESFLPVVDIRTIDGTASEGTNDTGLIRVTRTDNALLSLSVNATWATEPSHQNDAAVLLNGASLGKSFKINFSPGETTKELVIRALDDGVYNPGKKLTVTLAESANYKLKAASASVDLINTTRLPVSITASKPEAYLPNTPGEFRIDLGVAAPMPVTVQYTVSGSAPPNVRYQALSGSVTFQPGQTSVSIPVVPIQNYVVTRTQTVVVTLNAGTDFVLGAARSATVRIFDDNDNVFSIVVDNMMATPNGEPGRFRVIRAGDNLAPIVLDWRVLGSALPSVHFTPPLPASVTFGNGVREVSFTVNAIPFAPPDRSLGITLLRSPRYTVGSPPIGMLRIVGKVPVTKVRINGTIFSGASTVQDAVDAWVPEGVTVQGGVIALGSGDTPPSSRPVTLIPQPEYLNGTWIPPVVPYGIDVRIKQITTEAQ